MGPRRRGYEGRRPTSPRDSRAPRLRRSWRRWGHCTRRDLDLCGRPARTSLTKRIRCGVNRHHALVVAVAFTADLRHQTQTVIRVTQAEHLELVECRHWRHRAQLPTTDPRIHIHVAVGLKAFVRKELTLESSDGTNGRFGRLE